MNFNYQYKNPKAVITKWEYPTAGVTAVTFHPHVLWEKPEQVEFVDCSNTFVVHSKIEAIC